MSQRTDDDMIVRAVNRVLDCEYWLSFGWDKKRADRLGKARTDLADQLEWRDFHRSLSGLSPSHWQGLRMGYRSDSGRYREPFPPLGMMRWAASRSAEELMRYEHVGKIRAAAIHAWGLRMWGGPGR